jgi:hypothetical protein
MKRMLITGVLVSILVPSVGQTEIAYRVFDTTSTTSAVWNREHTKGAAAVELDFITLQVSSIKWPTSYDPKPEPGRTFLTDLDAFQWPIGQEQVMGISGDVYGVCGSEINAKSEFESAYDGTPRNWYQVKNDVCLFGRHYQSGVGATIPPTIESSVDGGIWDVAVQWKFGN